jgi:branched-chain amino acid transport system permease protein
MSAMDFEILLQQILNGLVLGSVYALVALGYTMVYGVLGLINFAHGEVVMIGALSALSAARVLQSLLPGLPAPIVLLLSTLLAIPVCMALGYAIERVAYRPLRFAPRLAPLITAIGVSILLQNIAMVVWGRSYHSFPAYVSTEPFHVFGATMTPVQVVIIVVSVAFMAGLMFLVHRTRLGRAMRATAENQSVAGLMGVDINAIISITFVIGSTLGAVAGVMVAANYSIAHYYMGFVLGLKAFTAAVLGGIGSLPGAVLGGLLIGVIEAVWSAYFSIDYKDVAAFSILAIVLIFLPQGILGRPEVEKV